MYKVAKFGGTSLADATQIRKVIDIVRSDPERKLIVVSAPGKRHADDTKITDWLIRLAEGQINGIDTTKPYEAILERFRSILADFALDPKHLDGIRERLDEAIATPRDNPAYYLDVIKSLGEDFSARVVALAMDKLVGPTVYVHPKDAGLILSDEPGNAQVLMSSYPKLAKLKKRKERVIFPGFFGATRKGKVVTFSRGGSDITGSILAAATAADMYENFTDVDNVYAADPRLVQGAAPVTELSYREMRELSYAGFSVFHDEALIPVFRARIPVCIRNTNRPEAPGTMLRETRDAETRPIAGIASSGSFVSINITKVLMNREVGFGRRLLQILEKAGVGYEHMPSGIDDISVLVKKSNLPPVLLDSIVRTIQDELKPDAVDVDDDLVVIMLVGEGMRYAVGIAARACSALARAGVNISMINQGASEISIMFGIASADRAKAVQALHDEFLRTA